MVNKRKVLRLLSRDLLLSVADEFGVEVEDRRATESAVDALAGSRKARLDVILPRLSRDELKNMCQHLGLDDTGREKSIIVARIIQGEAMASDDQDEGDTFRTTPVTKRDVVELMTRDELLAIVNEHAVEVEDRRLIASLVDGVVRAKRVRLARVLEPLSRERLKEFCSALELDSTGRERQLLIDRLCGEESPDADRVEAQESEATAAALLTSTFGEALVVEDLGKAWPTLAKLQVGDSPIPAAIYARVITGSSRGNPHERRFQNPSQKSRIVDDPNRTEFLWGIWNEQGPNRAVIVSFDVSRRYDKQTRYSMFMPLALLEQAADTGLAVHETASGEELVAFRPDRLNAYIERAQSHTQRPKERVTPAPQAQTHSGAANVVAIRPKVGMYSAFARLNYKAWFALAEFIDNSIQSFLANRERLIAAGHTGPLIVDVNIEDHELSITDRAGGISLNDFPRAFSPAQPPSDATGLSEFGLGMKAAACWFARTWNVRTSALGESVERSVTFDVEQIAKTGLEFLPIATSDARDSDHFTVVTLKDLRVPLRGRTLGKVKDHLRSIYREFVSSGILRLRITASGLTEELRFEQPELLTAPFCRKPAQAVLWRKELDIRVGERRLRGWAGLLKKGSHINAGFSILRRGRVVEGSHGDKYKPVEVFRSPNSFTSQRLVGELQVEGFEVSHTKDGLQWEGTEEEFLLLLKQQLQDDGLPMLEQAEGFRARAEAADLPIDFAKRALDRSEEDLSQLSPDSIERVALDVPPNDAEAGLTLGIVAGARTVRLREGNTTWTISVELTKEDGAPFFHTWTEISDTSSSVKLSLNLAHEFSVQHINPDERCVEPLVKVLAAYAVSELILRRGGVKHLSSLRNQINAVLRAMPIEGMRA